MAIWLQVYSIVAVCLTARSVIGKLDESVVRTASQHYAKKGNIIRQYSDGKDTVIAIFTSAYAGKELLECHTEKSNLEVTQRLLNQAVENPLKEHQFLVQMDVARMARKCRKLMRDTRRIPSEERTELQKRTISRLDLDFLVSGTEFCSRQLAVEPAKVANATTSANKTAASEKPVGSNATGEELSGDNSRVAAEETDVINNTTAPASCNACCKEWQLCTPYINALSTKNGLFNTYFWPMRSCECEAKFHRCLQQLSLSGDSQAKEQAESFTRLYFDELQPNCFEVHQEEKCIEYDFWHIECVEHQDQDVFTLKTKKVSYSDPEAKQ